MVENISDGLKEYAKYPLSLTVLGAIAIITAGIAYNVDIIKISLCVVLMVILFIGATIFNSWWFGAGRFSSIRSPTSIPTSSLTSPPVSSQISTRTKWQSVILYIQGALGMVLMFIGLVGMIVGYLGRVDPIFWQGITIVGLGVAVLSLAITIGDQREIKGLLESIKR